MPGVSRQKHGLRLLRLQGPSQECSGRTTLSATVLLAEHINPTKPCATAIGTGEELSVLYHKKDFFLARSQKRQKLKPFSFLSF